MKPPSVLRPRQFVRTDTRCLLGLVCAGAFAALAAPVAGAAPARVPAAWSEAGDGDGAGLAGGWTAWAANPAVERASSFAAPTAVGPQPQVVSYGTYTSLADTTTTATGQTTVFSSISSSPVISGSNVAFTAQYNANNGTGIFTGTAGTKGAATIADLTTTATGQTTRFSSNGFSDPVLSGSNVAFSAYYNANNGQGIFTGTAGTEGAATLADRTTVAAGQTTVFFNFYDPVLSGGNVAFKASYNGINGQGIFTGTAGTKGAATLADLTTTATGQTATFSSVGDPVLSGGNVAFVAYYNGTNGLGIFTGTAGVKGAATLADLTTKATGQTTVFSSFNSPVISGSNVAFRAFYNATNGTGIFTGMAGTKGAATIADLTTTATGQTTRFSSNGFSDPVLSGSNIAFLAFYNANNGRGIFTGTAGTKGALTLADYTTVAPGRGTFSDFSSSVLSISGSSVAFTAVSYVTGSSGTTGNGLFLSQNGTLSDIASVGEPLFGSTITSLAFSPSGLDGNTLTFEYVLANGVSGIETVTVPEPGTWLGGALLLATAALALRRRLRLVPRT